MKYIVVAALAFLAGRLFHIWAARCAQCKRWFALEWDTYRDTCRFCKHSEK
jgi:hypothetical protein